MRLTIPHCKFFMINLSIVQRANPKDLNAPRKYYVSTKSSGEIYLDTMSELISEKCTLTETDVLARQCADTRNVGTPDGRQNHSFW